MYKEYFNIMSASGPAAPLVISISFFIIIFTMVFLRYRHKLIKYYKTLAVLVLVGVLGIIVLNLYKNREFSDLKKVVIKKEHSIVEGVVSNFQEAGSNGLIPESFNVNGIEFSYYNDNTLVGFHDVSTFGGPIKNGLNVRIFYYKDVILGLWIKE